MIRLAVRHGDFSQQSRFRNNGQWLVVVDFDPLQARPVHVPAPNTVPDRIVLRLIGGDLCVHVDQLVPIPGTDDQALVGGASIDADGFGRHAHQVDILEFGDFR